MDKTLGESAPEVHGGATPHELMQAVYDRLRAVAHEELARERKGHTLQATALVNEAYLRLSDQTQAAWRDQQQFFAVAVTMIRRILVDHARARARMKRGAGWRRLTIHDDMQVAGREDDGLDLIALDGALRRLEALDPRQARIVELRFFGGRSIRETAAILSVSTTTVENDWSVARAWLRRELEGDPE